MTRPAYVAVAAGVAMMVLLTVDPAYEAAHHWVDAVLWACLAFFVFEWVVRLRHAVRSQRALAYSFSFRGLVDLVAAAAIPVALIVGASPKSAWLIGVIWVLKLVPGIPGLRQLRRVLVLESGPLLSVLVIFLMVVFLASVAEHFLERDVQPATFGSVPAALWWAVVTLTTTGYGDVVPITSLGRLVAAMVMISGLGVFGL
ncbi:MAG: potassium channel family protein, partial [Bradyrhizobium icense]